jgi:hypothetical protein
MLCPQKSSSLLAEGYNQKLQKIEGGTFNVSLLNHLGGQPRRGLDRRVVGLELWGTSRALDTEWR